MRLRKIIEIPVDKIVLPGDMRQRLERQNVKDLAQSMRALGLIINDPYIDPQYNLVVGRDRVAASILNKEPTIRVKMVDGTPDELRELELAENAHRRHDTVEREQAIREILRIRAERELAPPKLTSEAMPLTRIRENAARKLGIKPSSVRQAEWRAKKRLELEESPPKPKAPVESWGLELEDKWALEIAELVGYMQTLANTMASIVGRCQRLREQEHFSHATAQDMIARAKDLSDLTRSNIPFAVCPYCKGTDPYMTECAGCQGYGWIARQRIPDVPGFLKDPGNPVVQYRGETIPLGEKDPETRDTDFNFDFGSGE